MLDAIKHEIETHNKIIGKSARKQGASLTTHRQIEASGDTQSSKTLWLID